MTTADLLRIFFSQPTFHEGLRAVYEAGRKAEQEGSDDVTDADDYLRSLNGNYQVRA